MKNLLKRLWKEESGQDLTEYVLLLALVALVAVASMHIVANALSNLWSNAASTLAAQ